MPRIRPLIKLTLRMFCYSAMFFTVSSILFVLYRHEALATPFDTDLLWIAFGSAIWSIAPALVLALPLPLVTIVFFREIRRPALYRFTMLTVALLATLIVWEDSYIQFGEWFAYGGQAAGLAAATIARNAMAIFMSVIVADKYIHEVMPRTQKERLA